MMSELNPCPLCGGSAVYKTKSNIDDLLGTQTVSCRECCCSAPLHNWQNRPKLVEEIESPEDIDVIGEEILCFDGCDWVIDYVDVCAEWGHHYMANGTETVAWCKLPKKLDYRKGE